MRDATTTTGGGISSADGKSSWGILNYRFRARLNNCRVYFVIEKKFSRVHWSEPSLLNYLNFETSIKSIDNDETV